MSPGSQQLRSTRDRCLYDGHVVHVPIADQMLLIYRSSSSSGADVATSRMKGTVYASAQQLGHLSPCMSGTAETEDHAYKFEQSAPSREFETACFVKAPLYLNTPSRSLSRLWSKQLKHACTTSLAVPQAKCDTQQYSKLNDATSCR